jgi:YVTN family beta-propeller protein
LDPVSLRFRTEDEIWVVNQISDSVSIVDLQKMRVVATLNTLDAPADILFAGTPLRAFVSCAGADAVQVFDPLSRTAVGKVVIEGNRPKAMAASPDGARVYVAIFESGNASTIIGAGVGPGFPRATAVDFPTGPHGGLNPPPNRCNPVIGRSRPRQTNRHARGSDREKTAEMDG